MNRVSCIVPTGHLSIKEIATAHHLPPFTLAAIRHTLSTDDLAHALQRGERIQGLDGRPALTPEVLARTDNFVPVLGAEPFVEVLTRGANVVVAARASDCCPFAGNAMAHGIPSDVAYYWGKVLECASFACEPYMGKETILGTAFEDRIQVTAMHPEQRCTPASVSTTAACLNASKPAAPSRHKPWQHFSTSPWHD